MRTIIYSISMVKDEEDIIESFIRFNSLVIDKFFILDNGSTDNTNSILNLLKNEGFDIEILSDADTEFNQMYKTNELMHRILREYEPADFIIPLDADEFIIEKSGGNTKEIISNLERNKVYYYEWLSFVPTSMQMLNEAFIPARMDTVRVAEKEQKKIIIPCSLINDSFIIKNGSHDYFCDSEYEHEYISLLKLAHYPIRSVEQYTIKSILGYINRLKSTAYTKGISRHIEHSFSTFKSGAKPNFKLIKKEAKYYCLYDTKQKIKLSKFKFPYSYIKMHYAEMGRIDPQNRILSAVENLANDYRVLLLQEPAAEGDGIKHSVTKEIEKISFRKVREERLKFVRANDRANLFELTIKAAKCGFSIESYCIKNDYKKVVLYGDNKYFLAVVENNSSINYVMVEKDDDILSKTHIGDTSKLDIVIVAGYSNYEDYASELKKYCSNVVSLDGLLLQYLNEVRT